MGVEWRNVENFERKLEKSLKFVKCHICSKINVHDCLKNWKTEKVSTFGLLIDNCVLFSFLNYYELLRVAKVNI